MGGPPTVWTTTRSLTEGYRLSIEKSSGMKVVIEAITATTPKLMANMKGATDFTWAGTRSFWESTVNEFPWTETELGPQPIRALIIGGGFEHGPTATKTSGIKSWTTEAIRGKRIPYCPSLGGDHMRITALMAGIDITWDDVEAVPFASILDAQAAISEGTADIWLGGPSLYPSLKASASPYGITILELPPMGMSFWDKVAEVDPTYIPITTTGGLIGDRIIQFGGTSEGLSGYPELPDEVAYEIVKGVVEGYDEFFEPVSAYLKRFTLESTLHPWPLVFHPGAIKYYIEIGAWTEEMESNNKKQIRLEQERMAAWEAEQKK